MRLWDTGLIDCVGGFDAVFSTTRFLHVSVTYNSTNEWAYSIVKSYLPPPSQLARLVEFGA